MKKIVSGNRKPLPNQSYQRTLSKSSKTLIAHKRSSISSMPISLEDIKSPSKPTPKHPKANTIHSELVQQPLNQTLRHSQSISILHDEPPSKPLEKLKNSKVSLSKINEPIKANHFIEDIRSSKELAVDIKKCIGELKQEASLYMNSGKKLYKNTVICTKKNALENSDHLNSLDTETKGSFHTKTLFSTETCEDVRNKTPKIKEKAPTLNKNYVGNLQEKLELLMIKVNRSDEQAQLHRAENDKLRESIRDLESKLENVKMFHEPLKMSCDSKCEIF